MVTVSIVFPPERTVTIALSLPNFLSSVSPVALSLIVIVFVAPAARMVPAVAITTCFVLGFGVFLPLVALIALILLPLRCSVTFA